MGTASVLATLADVGRNAAVFVPDERAYIARLAAEWTTTIRARARTSWAYNRQGVANVILTDYTIVIRPDDNGTFVAYVPAIEGCHAWGRTSDQARAELGNVFDMIVEEFALARLASE